MARGRAPKGVHQARPTSQVSTARGSVRGARATESQAERPVTKAAAGLGAQVLVATASAGAGLPHQTDEDRE